MPSDRGKLTRGELRSLGYGARTERYFAPNDPRADEHGTISRRQAENERYMSGGWRNRADYERRYQRKTGRKFARFETEAIEQQKVKRRIGPDTRISKLWTSWRKTGFKEGGGSNSAAAKFLSAIGLRDPGAQYPVGATPPRKA